MKKKCFMGFSFYPFYPRFMFNYILFGIYVLAVLVLVGFLVIFNMHIRGYLQYSKYIKNVFRVYLMFVVLVTIFGGYKIFTGDTPSFSSGTSKSSDTINF